jgi:CubicO group peptidase (beta-lactamase class C family)
MVLVLLLGFASPMTRAQAAGAESRSERAQVALAPLIDALQGAVLANHAIGAQLGAGDRDGDLVARCFGTIAPGDERPVDGETLFGIGSCSKPFASTCLLTLVADGTVTLDEPIDRWLPAFRDLRVRGDGQAGRAPTFRELLAHRGGIFSQKEPMTPRQTRLIRNFRLTLAESVDGIAREPLIAPPGDRYAYSGAGYCVLGRVAEVAAGSDFETVFHARIARPLGLRRTTYFPRPGDPNVAIGTAPGTAEGRVPIGPLAPHLSGESHRLALVGGSLYSTAQETGRFARMILNQGRNGNGDVDGNATVLPRSLWEELGRRQFPGPEYSLGWAMEFVEGNRASVLKHNGALFDYRSVLMIDLDSGFYVVAHWTVRRGAPDADEDGRGDSIIPAARAALRRLADHPGGGGGPQGPSLPSSR